MSLPAGKGRRQTVKNKCFRGGLGIRMLSVPARLSQEAEKAWLFT